MNLSFQKLFYPLVTVFAFFAVLILAKSILIPLGLALLLSFILFPLAKRFESWGLNKMFAAFLSLLFLFLILGGIIFFFSNQIINLPNELANFKEKIMRLFADLILYFNNNFNPKSDLKIETVLAQSKEWFKNAALPVAQNTFYGTASFLVSLLAMVTYTFLLLIYRSGLTQAFVKFSPENKREQTLTMLKNIQKVGQKYLSGMLTLILILGLANSIGLWVIGIDSPFLFGFLAAVLAIIPFVGTTVGSAIPVLYAFMAHGSLLIPLAVIAWFWFVQLIDSNFLTPKILGNSLHVNALASILSLVIGAHVWGIAGMVLFLPFAAMLKVICEEYVTLKPVALLIGSKIYNGKEDNIVSSPKWFLRMKDWFTKGKRRSKK